MKTPRSFLLLAACASLAVCSASAQATLHAIGDLSGGTFFSEVRDVAKVGGTLHAVGQSNDGNTTAIYWTSSGGMVALPDLVANTGGTTAIIASAITPDAAYIAGRAYNAPTGNTRATVRYDTGNLSSPLNLAGPAGGAAVSISDNGNLLYGFAPLGGATRAFRYSSSGGTGPGGVGADAIDLLAGMTHNNFTARAVSADGSFALGSAGTSSTLQGAGTRAFGFDNVGPGTNTVSAVPLLSGGTWNQSLALNDAGTLALIGGDSTAYNTTSSELYLFNGSTTTALGAPGAGLMPNIFGGMNADGSVVGMSWTGTGGNTFIRNASGWHTLSSVATAAGLDMSNWSNLTLGGISEDGTLVWGSGLHSGNTEGYIMEFSSGYLAAIPEPSTYAMLAGVAALGLAAWRRRRAAV